MCMLNHLGESLLLQTDFLYMVEHINICINYLKSQLFFVPAALPGSGDISPPVPEMHNTGDDPHQDVLCRILTWINCRCIPLYFRKWVVFVNLGTNCVMLTHISRMYPKQLKCISHIYLFLKHLFSTLSSTRQAQTLCKCTP